MPTAKNAWIAAAAFAAIAMTSTLAEAVSVSCPGTAASTDREFTINTVTAATCLASGNGNIDGNGDAINLLGYVTLDKSDDSGSGELPQSLTNTPPTSGLSGTFSINVTGFVNLVIAFKTGQGGLNPDWAAFLLPAGVLSGSWSISGQQALSHANLYGQPSPVPLPAALPLFGAALGGLALFRQWRRRGIQSSMEC